MRMESQIVLFTSPLKIRRRLVLPVELGPTIKTDSPAEIDIVKSTQYTNIVV